MKCSSGRYTENTALLRDAMEAAHVLDRADYYYNVLRERDLLYCMLLRLAGDIGRDKWAVVLTEVQDCQARTDARVKEIQSARVKEVQAMTATEPA